VIAHNRVTGAFAQQMVARRSIEVLKDSSSGPNTALLSQLTIGLLSYGAKFNSYMSRVQLDSSCISEGTVQSGTRSDGVAPHESSAISRDDVRDGFADAPVSSDGIVTAEMHRVLAARMLTGDHVRGPAGDDVGSIQEIMIDVETGRIAYAVLSFRGFLGIGDKLFAVPWSALRIDGRTPYWE
jgi:sporulation protein YlmC with PRC-barrel domain